MVRRHRTEALHLTEHKAKRVNGMPMWYRHQVSPVGNIVRVLKSRGRKGPSDHAVAIHFGIQNLPQFPLMYQLLRFQDGRALPRLQAHQSAHALLVSQLLKLLGFREVPRERPFDEYVFAGLESGDDIGVVALDVYAYGDDVDGGVCGEGGGGGVGGDRRQGVLFGCGGGRGFRAVLKGGDGVVGTGVEVGEVGAGGPGAEEGVRLCCGG